MSHAAKLIDEITPCPGCGTRSSENYGGTGSCWQCFSATVANRIPTMAEKPNAAEADAGFALLSIADLAQLPPPSWLLQDLLPASGLSVLFGPSNVGKSFLALDWALCAASGLPWFGKAVSRQAVVYIAAEGVSGIYRRVQAWMQARSEPPPEGIRFVGCAANLLAESDVLRARLTISHMPEPPKLIVIDTMARSMVGGDENSSQDVGRFIAAVDELRNLYQAAVLVVHHTGKDGGDERGSSALRGAADAMLALKPEGAGARLECEKAKDAAPFDPWRLYLENVLESCVFRCGTNPAALAPTELRILEEVSAAFGTDERSATQILEASGVSKSSFYRSLKALVDRGFMHQNGEGRNVRYGLTANGLQQLLVPESPIASHETGAASPTQSPLYGTVGQAGQNGKSG